MATRETRLVRRLARVSKVVKSPRAQNCRHPTRHHQQPKDCPRGRLCNNRQPHHSLVSPDAVERKNSSSKSRALFACSRLFKPDHLLPLAFFCSIATSICLRQPRGDFSLFLSFFTTFQSSTDVGGNGSLVT